MLPDERRYAIVHELSQRHHGTAGPGAASVAELADLFGVSDMTIRRDLDWLEDKSLIQRIHGGAVASPYYELEKTFSERTIEHSEQKQAIGALAAQFIEDGDHIILDAGTTTRQVARHLLTRRELTVITNALPVAQELARSPQIRVIALGGTLKHDELCMVGPMVTRELARLSVDKVFLSAAGFDLQKGLTDPDIHEADVKEAMIQAADQAYLVADSSKWRQNALVRIAPIDILEALITDDGLSADAQSDLQSAGIRVVTPSQVIRSSSPSTSAATS